MNDLVDFKDKANGQDNAALAAAETQEKKGVAEIQAAYTIAKRFPRSEHQSYINIIDSCKRPSLAESAMYSYPRGGTLVEGPSIRLAEVLAQKWGNCKVGIEVLSQDDKKTEGRAYAIDMESNYSVDSCFTVKHQRTTKKSVQKLTDERDIRELIANIGSRHLRQCILRVIPSDVCEDAVAQVRKTLESSDVPIKEQVKKMVAAFDELGVKVEHLEKRLGHNLDATIASEIVTLKSIYKSIKDGMAPREQFFDIQGQKAEDAKEELQELVNKNKQESKNSQTKKTSEQAGYAAEKDAGEASESNNSQEPEVKE